MDRIIEKYLTEERTTYAKFNESNDFQSAFDKWFKGCEKIVDAEWKRMKNSWDFKLTIVKGKKYIKVVSGAFSKETGKSLGGRAAWAFVNTSNGDVLMPASWSAPTKKARGNIYDDKGGLGSITAYGPAYLK